MQGNRQQQENPSNYPQPAHAGSSAARCPPVSKQNTRRREKQIGGGSRKTERKRQVTVPTVYALATGYSYINAHPETWQSSPWRGCVRACVLPTVHYDCETLENAFQAEMHKMTFGPISYLS